MALTLKDVFAELDSFANSVLDSRPHFVDSAFLPDEEAISLEVPRWNRINNVSCLAIDMVGSSAIDYRNHERTSTKVYQAFTGGLIEVWRKFGAEFYDIKGDGGFALFDGKSGIIRAFLAGETFRTAVAERIRPRVNELTNGKVVLATRTALSFGSVVVKRIGVRGRYNNNLVWLGSTVNQAMKVLSKGSGVEGEEEFVVTPEAFTRLQHRKIRFSCGCGSSGQVTDLWKDEETPDLAGLGVERVHKLRSRWCKIHGDEYFASIAAECGVGTTKAA